MKVFICAAAVVAGAFGIADAHAVPPKPPDVAYCLQGTPGPAMYTDGEMRFSQWCYDIRGGQKYMEQENQSNRRR